MEITGAIKKLAALQPSKSNTTASYYKKGLP